MLKTKYFTFDRYGRLTLFLSQVSTAMLLRIMRMCNFHARRKKTKKVCQFRMIPTLTEVVA